MSYTFPQPKPNNFLEDILEALRIFEETEEDIQAVCLCEPRYDEYDLEYEDKVEVFPKEDFLDCHPWSYCRDKFNYEYDAGYGRVDCHNIVIYTTDTIYYIHEYDGSTEIRWISRNPTPPIKQREIPAEINSA